MLTKVVRQVVYWPPPRLSTLRNAEAAMGRMISEARQGSQEAAVDRERLAKVQALIGKSRERK